MFSAEPGINVIVKMKKLSEQQRLSIQFWLGVAIVIVGLVLLFLGFYAVPVGEIAPSVLTAFGEIATFSGALIGVDYRYRFKEFQTEEEYRHKRWESGEKEEENID